MKETPVNKIMESTLEKMREMVDVSTIIGEPMTTGDTTLIPVSKVTYGFTSGGTDLPSKQNKELFGGAGVQADLKTMLANGVFGESVITALTAQNTMGVDAVMNVPADFIEAQMKAVFTDIFPDAVKIGMTSSVDTIEAIAAGLVKYKAKNIVLDPVMVATSGSRLLEENAANTLMEKLFPLADIITPNIPELEVISGRQIESKDDIIEAAKTIYDKYGCPVLSKGGHFTDTACVCDYLWDGKQIITFETKRVDNPNSHGTGCTLSSAIASGLAKGLSLEQAVDNGKRYVTACLKAMLDLGKGSGPMNHGAMFIQ